MKCIQTTSQQRSRRVIWKC